MPYRVYLDGSIECDTAREAAEISGIMQTRAALAEAQKALDAAQAPADIPEEALPDLPA